jgi:Na+/H+ antiporter
VSLAIIDDVGAIIIIAIFYTDEIAIKSLFYAAFCIAILAIMNKRRVRNMAAYMFVGIILWVAVLKSGVHATLAGVALAMFIPLRTRHLKNSLARRLEYDLHAPVAYWILPLFAFANAGLDLSTFTIESISMPVPLGIFLGLFVGKQLGVIAFAWFAVKMKIASLPKNIGWSALYGTAILTGIGFTMSLFISGLAFDPAQAPPGVEELHLDRVGIFMGSLLSALVGYFYLKFTLKTPVEADKPLDAHK